MKKHLVVAVAAVVLLAGGGPVELQTAEAQWTGGGYGFKNSYGFCETQCFGPASWCECYRLPDIIVEG